MINDTRRAERRSVHESVAVIDTMTEQAIGRLGNISESGMLLVASAPLQEDALYQLRFDITDGMGRALPIEVGAQLLWFGSANTPGQSWAGLRFLTIGDSQRAALQQWISGPNLRR